MDFGRYDDAAEWNPPIFDGHRTRLAIEGAAADEFRDQPHLIDELIAWGHRVAGDNPFGNTATGKWRFLSIQAVRGSHEAGETVKYRDFGRPPADDPEELLSFARRVRRGQAAFRTVLLDLSEGRCAVTGWGPPRVLQACHIASHAATGINDPANGLLLRADIHELFDDVLLRIRPEDCVVEIDESLRETPYWEFHGRTLRPRRDGSRPSEDFLRVRYEHRDHPR